MRLDYFLVVVIESSGHGFVGGAALREGAHRFNRNGAVGSHGRLH